MAIIFMALQFLVLIVDFIKELIFLLQLQKVFIFFYNFFLTEQVMRSSNSIFRQDLENEQVCPITQQPFQDPVVTVDGHTYERKAILEWFEKHQTSPKTNLPLHSKEIVPNHALRNMITNFLPRFMTLYEGKKEQMQRKIQQLRENHYQIQVLRNNIQYAQENLRLQNAQKNKLLQDLNKYKFRIQESNRKSETYRQMMQRLINQNTYLGEEFRKAQEKLKLFESQIQKCNNQLKLSHNQIQELKSQLKEAESMNKHLKQTIQKLQAEKITKCLNQINYNTPQPKQQNQEPKKSNSNSLEYQTQGSQSDIFHLEQKICYELLLKQSSILDKQGLKLLAKWLVKPIQKIQLKFKASSNDFSIDKYYKSCGSLENTIIIVKTSKDKVLGGYTPLSFNPPGNIWTYKEDHEDVKDQSNSSFIFSLSQKKKFQLTKDNHAIKRYKNKKYIQFSSRLKLADKSNKSMFFLLYKSYNTSKYPASKQSYLKLTGQQSWSFSTSQWQVLQVFFT